MRIPIAADLESRDGSLRKDAFVKNALIEVAGQDENGPILKLRKRPGVVLVGTIKVGTAQLLYSWNGLQAIIGDYLNSGTVSSIVSAPVQVNLAATNPNLPFTAQETSNEAATPRLMFKNRTQAWTLTRAGGVTAVTYGGTMGSETYSVTSITRSGGTATVTMAVDPGFKVDDSVVIAGAAQPAYNGTFSVTAATPASFTPERDITISSLTRVGTTATAVANAHGLTTATAYTIQGANQSAYNGSHTITVVDANTFTYTVTVTASGASAITGTWNSLDKSAHIALSGASLVATNDSTGIQGLARGTASKAAGKWLWEVTLTSGTTSLTSILIGIAKSTTPTSDYVGQDANSYGFSLQPAAVGSGNTVHNGASTTYGQPVFTVGDVIGVLLDFTAGTLTFYKNGVSMGIAYSGISGTYFPAISFSGVAIASVTAKFSSPFTYDYDSPATTAMGSPIQVVDPAVSVPATFTYTVAGSPATPATGTITAQGSGGTVPGIPYINGYFFVMDTNGVIWNSALDDPTSWDSLAFIIAQSVNGAGQALTQSGNYLVALKDWSAEYFYDAKKSPGSPLDLVSPAFADIGCASGDSAIRVNGVPIWISQTREQPGRAVHILQGLTPVKVSTLSVERILDADDLVNVMAMPSNFDGHPVYIVTLPTSNVTLMYDFNSKTWGTMTALNAGSPKSVSSITFDNSNDIATATVAAPGHGLSDGDPVTIAGADQPEYNGTFPALVVDADTFTTLIPGNPGSSATGTITATGYTESTLPASKIASHLGAQFALHDTAGLLLQLSTTVYKDAAAPIDTFARSQRLDGGTLKRKKMSRLRVVGDFVNDIVLVRWSDDDCQTFSSYQRVDLSEDQPEIRKGGSFRRRTLEMRHTGNNQINLLAYEPDIG